MYDEIVVKQQLPLPDEIKHLDINWNEYVFQTKDLDNCLSEYIIEDNQLYEKHIERKYVEYTEEEKKQRKKQKQFYPVWKDVIEVSSEIKPIEDFHGTLVFYAFEKFSETEDFWLDFKAYFVYGKLDKIDLLEFKRQKSNSSSESIKDLIAQHQKCPWTKFKKYASYFGWRWCWRQIASSLHAVSSLCESARTFVIRYCL